MAPPADLADVGREGFAMIDKLWGHRRRPQPPPPPPREAETNLLYHPYVHHFTESPLITETLPYASRRAVPHETIVYHTQHRYIYRPSPAVDTFRVSRFGAGPMEYGGGAIDCNKAADMFKGKATIEYGGF